MKLKLQKTLFLFVLALFAVQVHGQAWGGAGAVGTYRIKVNTQDLYLTLPDDAPVTSGSQTLTFQPLDMTNNRQIFDIQQISGNNYSITSVIPGKGVVEIDDTEANPVLVVKGRDADDVPDRLYWWNPTRGTGTQLFSENNSTTAPFAGTSKRRLQNTTGGPLSGLAGTDVKCSGGGPLKLDYVLSAPLSTEEFDTSSIFISNPVKDELSIDGLTANVKQISIYNLLGQRVMLSNVEDNTSSIKLDVSSFSSGVYIVKLEGENLSNFSKKIVKE
jgi:hypothetical protein